MRAGAWSEEEIATLLTDHETGVSRRKTAESLGRLVSSVDDKAKACGLRRRPPVTAAATDDKKLRDRWLKRLPKMKEDLRRELNA